MANDIGDSSEARGGSGPAPGHRESGRFARWLPSYRAANGQFTFVCFFAPAVLGSVASVALNGFALWAFVAVCIGFIGLSRDRGMVLLAIPIYAYCLFYLASFAANPASSDSLRYLPMIVTFLLFPFLYSNWSISDKPAIVKCAVLASMISCYGAVAIAALQFHLWGGRAEGGAGNAIVFATAISLAASVSLAGLLMQDRRWTAPLAAAFFCGTIATLYSGSRIGWVALVLSSAVVLYIYRGSIGRRFSARTAAAVLLAALIVAAAGAGPIAERVEALANDWEKLSSSGLYDTSLGLRAALWDIGLERAWEKPILGHGPQSTARLISSGLEAGYGIRTGFSHFHNGFLTALVETGLAGMLSLGAIFLVAANNARRTLRSSRDPIEVFGAVLLAVAVVTYLVFGMAGILVGHDILDAVLMAFLITGTYLSSGTSAPTPQKPWARRTPD